jgi:hypothetical protein
MWWFFSVLKKAAAAALAIELGILCLDFFLSHGV